MIETYKTQLVLKRQLTHDVWHLRFSLLSPSSLSFIAGQYMILKIEDRGQRNYSILSSTAKKDSFELLVQIIPQGLASTYIENLALGAQIIFQGPAGRFVLNQNNRKKVFLATGTGIAPIFSMLESSISHEGVYSSPMHLFWGLKTKEDVYFTDKLELLKKAYPHFSYTICLSREEDVSGILCAKKGRINTHVLDYVGIKDAQAHDSTTTYLANEHDYYICGGRNVVEAVRQFVIGLGVLRENVYFEKF